MPANQRPRYKNVIKEGQPIRGRAIRTPANRRIEAEITNNQEVLEKNVLHNVESAFATACCNIKGAKLFVT